jgi:hypothetical protein
MKRKALMIMTWAMLAVAGVSSLPAMQGAQIKVDVGEHHSAWYTNPLYIGLGIIILLLIVIALTRGRSNTTVVK